MAAASDIFLGWLTVEGIDGVSRDYYVRQLRDWKGSAMIEAMVPGTMAFYGRLCGRPWPARTPLRRSSRDRLLPRSEGRVDQALAGFAEAYQDETNATPTLLSEPRRMAASPRNAAFDRHWFGAATAS